MKFDYDEIHYAEVENICLWLKDKFPHEDIMKKDTVFLVLMIHILASLRNIETYCINMLGDKYGD